MEVYFTQYRFVNDQLTLYKGDEIVPLKHTQALLLRFFLKDPDGIHSKDAIMSTVWKDKVVSEQVVFQTISQLRSLFGSDAIRTFSKKGYKWQLALQASAIVNDEKGPVAIEHEKPKVSQQSKWLVGALLILIALFSIVVDFYPFSENNKVTLHVVQKQQSTNVSQTLPHSATNSNSFIHLASLAIQNDDKFSVKYIPEVNSASQLFLAPKRAWRQANLPAGEWLLWTEKLASPEGMFLNYGLSNGVIDWHGYVYSKTNDQLAQKFSGRLSQIQQLGLFSNTHHKLTLSTLTSMMEFAPNDPDLLLLLAQYYFEVKQLEVAMTYANKLVNLDDSYAFRPYRARAQWLMGDIYQAHGKYELAENSLNSMSASLRGTPLWSLHGANFSARAWVAKELGDFETMFAILDQGLVFSQQHFDALNLFYLQISYSILAKKAGDNHKKYMHLNEAQALLFKHKLDASNLAVVYYHFAIFTNDNNKALPYLEKILELPRTKHNAWVIDHSTELLIDQYIERQEYDLAQTLLTTLPESPKFLLSRAKLLHVTEHNLEAHSYYEKAFELARLEHNRHLGVHAAFGLFQLTAHLPNVQAEYMDYLDRNAKKEWLNDQMKNLAKHSETNQAVQ